MTSDTVASWKNPTPWGEHPYFWVTFAPTAPGAGTPTGMFHGYIDGAWFTYGQAPSDGTLITAVFDASKLSLGTHVITGHYDGDANFNPSDGTLTGGQTMSCYTVTLSLPALTLAWQGAAYSQTVAASQPWWHPGGNSNIARPSRRARCRQAWRSWLRRAKSPARRFAPSWATVRACVPRRSIDGATEMFYLGEA